MAARALMTMIGALSWCMLKPAETPGLSPWPAAPIATAAEVVAEGGAPSLTTPVAVSVEGTARLKDERSAAV